MGRPRGSQNRTPAEIMADANIAKKKAELKILEQKKKKADDAKKAALKTK